MKSRHSLDLLELCLFLGGALLFASSHSQKVSADLASFDRKLEHIERNGRSAHPDPAPTLFTEAEVNAYLASDEVGFPAGVESLRLQGQAETVTGTARVDFDRLRRDVRGASPLLEIFTGVHDVVVVTHASGTRGQATVHVDSVSLDGVEVPRFVLRLFVEKYIQPEYPQIGLDSRFSLPDRIQTATVGRHTLTLTQH
ncbi:MAG: hypothetical protein JO159_08170 [Acidobacteria bacterium]|nr:hypothetical protein [Acidobacteriota bacterium]MBV9623463.1 hypothetical protein [Acidobacteriota bacterium]